ncbi:MAG: esterase-like activity of phytase family protein [Bdellovibrio sp.]
MKVFVVALVLFSFASSAHALRLHYYGETAITTGTKFNNTIIGGISGIVWHEGRLLALSDDKGRVGEPRFYEFDLKLEKNLVSLTPKAVKFVTNLPLEGARKAMLDPEGLARLADGDLLISSEANTDAKPRSMPRIFRTNSEGAWKSDFVLPEKYLPELLGKQSKGVQNNQSLEGLTTFADGKIVFTSTESCLTQDIVSGEEVNGDIIRILKFEDKGAQHGYYTPVAEFVYKVDAFNDNQKGKEIFRGVSEILALSETKMLVMERGVRINGKGWSSTVSLYLADLSKATNTLAIDKVVGQKVTFADKTKLIDFETDLVKERGQKMVDNFEGLSWGPLLPDGRRSLLVMVDNNFKKNETTELVVFSVEGE